MNLNRLIRRQIMGWDTVSGWASGGRGLTSHLKYLHQKSLEKDVLARLVTGASIWSRLTVLTDNILLLVEGFGGKRIMGARGFGESMNQMWFGDRSSMRSAKWGHDILSSKKVLLCTEKVAIIDTRAWRPNNII